MSNFFHIPDDFPIKNVLVVDDEESLRTVLLKALEKAGFSFKSADSAEDALKIIKTRTFELVITDIVMPGMDGIELLQRIKTMHPLTDVIVVTGYGSQYSYVDIMNAGASDYVTKPFNLSSLMARINRIARERRNLINLKKTNQELCMAIERANVLAREAKEASKAKTFFLASMSHEIRTPLNGIVGYTDMLQDTPLNDEQRSFLKHAKLSCDALLSVVNDILDFSKVEAGRMTLENIGFDPEVLCFETIDVVRTRVDESQVELMVSVGDQVPGQVMGDPHRFRQVLLNLLSNAAKFTAKGHIRLGLDSEEIEPGNCRLIITISDTGIGIDASQVDKIFHPFIQSEDDITNRYGGTGLGLAISKNIANKMNGDIRVESSMGEGSTFYFTSSFRVGENKKVERVKLPELKGKKVALCTDSESVRQIISHELESGTMEMSHVPLDQADSIFKDASFTPDVALMDFGNHGRSYIKRFVKNHSAVIEGPETPGIIACSIPAPGIADLFEQAGFKGYLSKPVSRRKLFDMIGYVLGACQTDPSECHASNDMMTSHQLNENKKHSVSILLVEDNPVNQKMTSLMLSKAGYTIEIAADGQESLKKYTAQPDAYDLVLMDINMPRMNGFEAAAAIRKFEEANPEMIRVPILALTANVLDDFKHRCTDAGMDDFLTKPIKRDVVFTAIRKWVDCK